MGDHNHSGLSATTICLPIICQWDRLNAIITMVVVDRSSPTSKKRPATTGLFLSSLYVPSLVSYNIHGFAQRRLVEVTSANVIGESQR
jgi:hypothetical protein